ncbi:hypothetical protein GBF38_022977 [Nibea albiflora]|uniref:Uncharacterized protein n=1 Tax=Nibea albiflora TaxID=240163 RepID=A0ACB7EXY2_NIBAL|nr:hypothetical protein GBF38_022977 [Nibea albiflora]
MPPTAQRWRVSRINWASLRGEQWRPEAVLLSRRRGGGSLPVVSPCRSFWERRHTCTKAPQSSHQPAPGVQGPGCRGREKNGTLTTEQLDSVSRMSSSWPESKPEASQAPLTSELSP